MELLFVTVIAAGLGTILRYVLPHREATGLLLLPGVAAAVTAAVWVGMLWLGLTFDGGWIWVIALVAGTVAALIVGLVLPPARDAADARFVAEASRAR